MLCPYCDGKTSVKSSRDVLLVKEGKGRMKKKRAIRQRERVCSNKRCSEEFLSYEVSQSSLFNVLSPYFTEREMSEIAFALAKEFPEKGEGAGNIFDFEFDDVPDF